MDKAVKNQKQSNPTNVAGQKTPLPAPAPARVPPLFRSIDWIALGITFAAVWVTYLLTLAPEQTLEDSGELCTGAFYAGIPHPPGYPFWTIYAWLWTKLLPFGNVAWRVEVGQATAAAMGCGLVAFVVSRGSSMLMEGISELKSMTGKWENAICLVSGAVAGLLLGLGSVMWSESVAINRISLFGVPWLMIVLTCMLRWIYAPHQWRYLYCAMFFFGICATIHQTLLVAAMGIEVAIAVAQPRLGRNLFLWNSIIFLCGLIAKSNKLINLLDTAQMVLIIYWIVGILSIAAYVWFAISTRESMKELCRDGALAAAFLLAPATRMGGHTLLAMAALATFFWLGWNTRKLGSEWLVAIALGLLWVLGASFYFYMPIAGMTNPPMQWGYPRTVEGFFHALSRGQYEKANPTDIFGDPNRFFMQLEMLVGDIAHEFNWVCLFVALVPLFFFFRMQKRERAWILGLAGIYFCIGVLLIILMNPSPERQSAELIKVFFTSSHAVVAILVGYGLALIASFMATHYQKFRLWGFIGGGIAALVGLYCLWDAAGKHYFGPGGSISLWALPRWVLQAFAKDQVGLPIFGNLFLVGIPVIFLAALLVYRQRAPLAITLAVFALMPMSSGLSNWAGSEQRGHWFGYWFGHDMFTPPFNDKDGKPIYPEMAKDTILFGGTDPGRFCPTYMIFCESFIPHECQPELDQEFDRRDVYLITQNALADGTYLCYLRAQYFRSQQIDPPFFSELARTVFKDKDYETNFLARLVSPLDTFFAARGARIEKRWRTSTSRFTETDFTNLPALVGKMRPGSSQDALSQWLFQNCSKTTQELLGRQGDEAPLRAALAKDLDRLLERELEVRQLLTSKQREKAYVDQEIADGASSEKLRTRQEQLVREIAELKVEPLYESNRFAQVKITDYLWKFIAQNPQGDTRIRLNRLLLEAAYPGEIARSLGGVYPDREIYIPSNEDSQRCFQEYIADASARLAHDRQFPHEQKQIKPGEGVYFDEASGRVQVTGQVAVMSINGLLTKVIFDRNPDNEFYVEESFPLDWMFPRLTPFGIIMKINRHELPELTDDDVRRDHEFWSQYSERLTGNWLTYDTPVSNIVSWIEKVYLRHNLSGFTGDRRFIRDNQAQKAFSKLRSSIAGIYAWRLGMATGGPTPPQYLPKNDAERQRMIKEADFAFRQAFVYCPYSPEAVFRYVQFLMNLGRVEDARMIAETCRKLDPENGQVINLVNQLDEIQKQPNTMAQIRSQITQLEAELRANPTDFQKAFDLASKYMGLQQSDRAYQILDGVVNHPQAPVGVVLSVVQAYAQMNNIPKLEGALERLVKLAPTEPEAFYDLASAEAMLGKPAEALPHLEQALALNAQRLAQNPQAHDIRKELDKDPRFAAIRGTPEFKALATPK